LILILRLILISALLRFLRQAPLSTTLAGICLLVYLAMILSGAHFANPHSRALIEWGASYRLLTVQHQPWRLVSSMFIHGGLIHLLMNSAAILDIGWQLEQRIGSLRLGSVMLLSGLAGGLAAIIWHPLAVPVGISGAMMGAAGCLLVWLAWPLQRPATPDAAPFLTLLVVLTATLALGEFWQRMDNAAHVGGLLAGLACGIVLRLAHRRSVLASTCLLVPGLLLISLVLHRQNLDEFRFRADLPALNATLNQYANPLTMAGSPEKLRAGAESWQHCLNNTQSWSSLKLSKQQELLGQQIRNLCQLQQQQYRWLAEASAANSANPATVRPGLPQPWLVAQAHSQQLFATLQPSLQQELALVQQVATLLDAPPIPGQARRP
jgi:membrane associated rhomboid family serine protease